MTEDQKMAGFGRMVFDLISTLIVSVPSEDQGIIQRSVTLPDGKGGLHNVQLIVTTPELAKVIDEAVAKHYFCRDIIVSKEKQ